MLWGPWRSDASHIFVNGDGVLDMDLCLCGYRYASHAASFADAPAWHMCPRSWARCIWVQRCFYLILIAF